MTESQPPFGEGGFDMNALLQQAQQMQQQMMAAQQELADTLVEGTVAGGAVTATVNGTGELVALSISEGSVDLTAPDALTDLADLVLAAYRDGRTRSEAMAAEKLGPLAGGLGGLGGPEDGPGPGHQLGF
jgi:DNA-binding YbaB/EbfC family protein